MQGKKQAEPRHFEAQVSRAKAVYVAPRLRIYVAVGQLTAGSGSNGADSGTMTMNTNPMMSDRTLKQNIIRIGTHPAGFGLYLFDYKPQYRQTAGYGRHFGVMADEVERVLPDAVVMHPDGYKQVDYALLGITLAGKGCPLNSACV